MLLSDEKISRKRHLHIRRLMQQYQLLLSRWKTTAVAVTLADIAQVLDCSPRHTRILLNAMMDLSWLTWAGQAGRGAKGRLHCRVKDIANLEDDIAPEIMLAPHVQDKPRAPSIDLDSGNKVFIKFYRPIDQITPSDHTGRVERHLLKMVHAGLMRFDDEGFPVPDLASCVQSSDNYKVWTYTLRKNLTWHNGKPATAEQLHQVFNGHLKRPAFRHVISAWLNGEDIVIQLSRPDAMLGYRLANPVHALAHPDIEEAGLGPYRLVNHDNRQLLLEAYSGYHGRVPALNSIEYRIEAGLPKNKWTTRSLFLAGEDESDATETYLPENDPGFVFLVFNEQRGGLTDAQKAFIRELAKIAVQAMVDLDNIRSVASVFSEKTERVPCTLEKLPASLTLKYFWCPEIEVLMKHLQRQMLYWGCNLVLMPVDANLWFLPARWEECDIGVSDLRFGERWYFAPEERFCHSVMIKNLMIESTWLRLEKLGWKMDEDPNSYPRNMLRLMRMLIRSNVLTPMISLKFVVKATPRIQGVKVLTQGWADYTKIRIE